MQRFAQHVCVPILKDLDNLRWETVGSSVKQRLAEFLREDLMLEMSPDKTLITHARTGAAKFLGYEITVQHDEQQLTRGRRAVNGQIKLLVPESVIKA